MRKLFATAIASAFILGASPVVHAGDPGEFGLTTAACEDAVVAYMQDRLYDPRAARVHLTSDPYQVVVSLRDGREVDAWAVDVRVRSRLPTGSWSGYQPYTVIFQNGVPVALEGDLPDVARA